MRMPVERLSVLHRAGGIDVILNNNEEQASG